MSRVARGHRVDPREIAIDILVRVAETDAFADVLLARRLNTRALAPADRGLATELVYGTLTWQGRLDHHLAGLVRTPLAELEPRVLAALRLGLYQLLFLDRVPAYAAVDASVRLAAPPRHGARGLVNAVLRRASRMGRSGFPLPDAGRDPIERLAVEWSHPRWLVERWVAETNDLPALLEANDRPAPTVIRARGNRSRLIEELAAAGVDAVPGAFADSAIVVRRGAERLRRTPAYRDGRFAFQGEASQLVAASLEAPAGARVLDACAGRGGKAFAMAERLGGTGRVLALDPRVGTLARMVEEARRLGDASVFGVAADARRPPTAAAFDAVLVDAPCTGLGTLRQHPELKWRRRPDDVTRLARLQRDLLHGVADCVRAGGRLVYAVCTHTREETTDVVRDFVGAHPRFVVEPIAAPAALRDDDGMLRTAPHRHGLDGFFAAALQARR